MTVITYYHIHHGMLSSYLNILRNVRGGGLNTIHGLNRWTKIHKLCIPWAMILVFFLLCFNEWRDEIHSLDTFATCISSHAPLAFSCPSPQVSHSGRNWCWSISFYIIPLKYMSTFQHATLHYFYLHYVFMMPSHMQLLQKPIASNAIFQLHPYPSPSLLLHPFSLHLRPPLVLPKFTHSAWMD